MNSIIRTILVSITLMYLVPAALIELTNLRAVVNSLFLACCTALCAFGLLTLKKSKDFALFEKLIGSTGIIITLILSAKNALSSTFYIEGYKFLLIFILIFFGSELSKAISASRIIKDLSLVLSLYTCLLITFFIITGADNLIRPVGAGEIYTRLDITGSVTIMAISSTISLLLISSLAMRTRSLIIRIALFLIAFTAGYLILLSASRQAILVIVVYATLQLLSGKLLNRKVIIRRASILGAALASILLFTAYTAFINDSLYVRIFENPTEDYSSGRLNSVNLWLSEMHEHGGPLGFGHIRNNTIQEIELLWPHNEFLRFYIEGGIPGAFLTFLMLIYAISTLRFSMRPNEPSLEKNLTLIIFSVFIVQMSVENFINNTFLSTLCFLLLSICTHSTISQQRNNVKPKKIHLIEPTSPARSPTTS